MAFEGAGIRRGLKSDLAISVFIADDQFTVLDGLSGAVGMDGDLRLVAVSGVEDATLSMVDAICPDVVVLGLCVDMSVNGFVLCRQIKSLSYAPQVLIHTAPGFLGVIAGAVIAGADGYLHKGSPNVNITEAVKRLARQEEVWEFAPQAKDYKRRVLAAARDNHFTPLEQEVFYLMCHGMTNTCIARELHRSPHTIRDYARRILCKLEIGDRRHLYAPAHLVNNI